MKHLLLILSALLALVGDTFAAGSFIPGTVKSNFTTVASGYISAGSVMVTNNLKLLGTLNGSSLGSNAVVSLIGKTSNGQIVETDPRNFRTVITSNSVPSSTGFAWSRSTQPIYGASGFPTNRLDLRSLTNSQTIVVLGSSTAQGAGSANGTNGWAEILRTNLMDRGFTVLNASIGGTRPGAGTNNGISRYYNDVSPVAPRFVMIAYVLGNEGITSLSLADKWIAAQNYQSNRMHLASMIVADGAIPILITPITRGDFTANDYAVAQWCYWQDQQSGYPVIDFTSVLDNFQGGFATAYDADGIHPNDEGHKALFAAISPSIFTMAPRGPYIYQPNRNAPSTWLLGDNAGAVSNAWVVRPTSMQNYSISMWLRYSGTSAVSRAFLQPNNASSNTRLRNPVGEPFQVFNGVTPLYSPTASENTNWHHAVLTWSTASNLLYFYWDGSLVGSLTEANGGAQGGSALFHSRFESSNVSAYGYEFREHGMWRTMLMPWQIREIYKGKIPLASAEGFWPLDDDRIQGLAKAPRNVAYSTTSMIITNGDYASGIVPIGFPNK